MHVCYDKSGTHIFFIYNLWKQYSTPKIYKDKDNTTHNKIKKETNNTVTVNQAVDRAFAFLGEFLLLQRR